MCFVLFNHLIWNGAYLYKISVVYVLKIYMYCIFWLTKYQELLGELNKAQLFGFIMVELEHPLGSHFPEFSWEISQISLLFFFF
jgi:hypothetical protein